VSGFSGRALTAEEDALLETVRVAAREPLENGTAELTVDWWRWKSGPLWPEYVLTPTKPAACRVSLSAGAGDWIDFDFGPAGSGNIFELWAREQDERLALAGQCVRAVVDGRSEIELRPLWRLRSFRSKSWRIVGTFQLPTGSRSYSRGPTEPEDYRFAFGDAARADDSGRLGPHRFSPYARP